MKNQNLKLKAIRVLAVILVSIFSYINLSAQHYINEYDTRCGAVSGTDYGRSIINRVDSGYAIGGYSYASACGIGPYDWMFIKVKPDGNHNLLRLIGTASDDKCFSLIQSSKDSGYVMAGYMYHQATSMKRATLVKLDKSGNLQYSKIIYDSLNSAYSQVINDPSNTRGLTGWDENNINGKRRNKILVSQYDGLGNKNWAYRYDSYITATNISGSIEEANSICFQPIGGGNYGVAARTTFFSGLSSKYDILVMKLSYTGAIIWKKVYRFNIANPVNYPSAEPKKIIPMTDGGFVIVGSTNAYANTESDIIVFRVNASGGLMWSYTYGNTGVKEFGNSIITDAGSLVIAGYKTNTVGTTDALLMKIPLAGGAATWTRLWDPAAGSEAGYDLVNSNIGVTGGYAITGDASANANNAFLWRTDVNGQVTGGNCNNNYFINYRPNDIKLDSFIIQRRSLDDKSFTPSILSPNMVTSRICSGTADNMQGMEEDNINAGEVTDFKLDQNYPNPFNPSTSIKFDIPVSGFVSIKVFDVSGKEVYSIVNEVRSAGRHEVTFNASGLSSGVYYYRIASGNFNDIKKMILVK